MRALVVPRRDAPPVVEDVPRPRPGDGQILVRVRAAALNPVDSAIAAGRLAHGLHYDYPVTLGRDFAGVVEEVGPGSATYAPGDAVFGFVPLADPALHAGSLAEYVVVDEAGAVAAKPPELPFPTAAALAWAGATATLAVRAVAPQAGDVVLVVGATGGVGRTAVVLAAQAGATVVATGRAADGPQLRALGAAEVVDYAGDVAAAVRARHPGGIDALLYLVAPPSSFASVVGLVGAGGRVATCVHAADVDALAAAGVSATNVLAAGDPEMIAGLGAMAAAGLLEPQIGGTRPLAELAAAFPSSTPAGQRVRGKLVMA